MDVRATPKDAYAKESVVVKHSVSHLELFRTGMLVMGFLLVCLCFCHSACQIWVHQI